MEKTDSEKSLAGREIQAGYKPSGILKWKRGSSMPKNKSSDKLPNETKQSQRNETRVSTQTLGNEHDAVSSLSIRINSETGSEDLEDSAGEEKYRLKYFYSFMMASILEDALRALMIIESANNPLRITEVETDMSNLLAKKFGVSTKPQNLAETLESVKPKDVNSEEYKIKKFVSDRAQLTSSLTKIYKELALDGTFYFLMNEIQEVAEETCRNQKLQEENDKNKTEVRELRKQLRLQRVAFSSTLSDTNTKMEMLADQIQDANLRKEAKGRYVHNWQNARREQLECQLENRDEPLLTKIEEYRNMYDQEKRASNDMKRMFNILIEETNDEIEFWMDKYDIDIENIDTAIQVKRAEYERMLDKRKYLEKKYEDQARDMESWLKFKKDREEKRQYVVKMNKCATIVQAWWRGILVRHSMGPYRKTKKGRGGRRKK